MIYQISAQKYKWKAISILHENAKLISAQRGPSDATRAPECMAARGAAHAALAHAREAAHDEEACGTLEKMPSRY